MSAGQADRGDASPVAERTRPACGRLDTRCGPSQGQAGWTTDAHRYRETRLQSRLAAGCTR
jgi:hypothetical protein